MILTCARCQSCAKLNWQGCKKEHTFLWVYQLSWIKPQNTQCRNIWWRPEISNKGTVRVFSPAALVMPRWAQFRHKDSLYALFLPGVRQFYHVVLCRWWRLGLIGTVPGNFQAKNGWRYEVGSPCHFDRLSGALGDWMVMRVWFCEAASSWDDRGAYGKFNKVEFRTISRALPP